MSTGPRSTLQDRLRDLDARVVAGDLGGPSDLVLASALLLGLVAEAELLVEEVARRVERSTNDAVGLNERCRLALVQLDEARHRLTAPESDPAHAGVHADLVRADLRRTLSLVRSSLFDGEPGAPNADAQALLVAVTLRRRYARLRQALKSTTHDARPEHLRASLLAARDTIAGMRAEAAFAHVRVADRLQLANIQSRVETWLAGPGDADEGARLHRLLVLLSSELLHINQRSALRHHDADVLQHAAGALAAADPEASVPPPVAAGLEGLEGRDERVDDALAAFRAGETRTVERLRQSLATAAAALGLDVTKPR